MVCGGCLFAKTHCIYSIQKKKKNSLYRIWGKGIVFSESIEQFLVLKFFAFFFIEQQRMLQRTLNSLLIMLDAKLSIWTMLFSPVLTVSPFHSHKCSSCLLWVSYMFYFLEFSAHRNDNLAASLRSLCNELKAKEPQSERKRKKVSTKKDDKASSSNAPVRTTDL